MLWIIEGMQDSQSDNNKSTNDQDDIRREIEALKIAQATQAAVMAGAESTSAALAAGAQATQAAVTVGAQATQAAAVAGLWSTVAAGFVALTVGLFIGANVKR